MRKIISDLKKKTVKDLEKEVLILRQEIGKLKIEMNVSQQKDTNILFKKKKQLARVLTILSEKRELEAIKNLTQK